MDFDLDIAESALAHIVVSVLVCTCFVCGHVPFVLRVLFPCAGMTVVDTVAGTVVVEVVAVEAVVGKVFDLVVAAEVVENIVVVVRRMAVLVAWLYLPYSPLPHVVTTLCALVCPCC